MDWFNDRVSKMSEALGDELYVQVLAAIKEKNGETLKYRFNGLKAGTRRKWDTFDNYPWAESHGKDRSAVTRVVPECEALLARIIAAPLKALDSMSDEALAGPQILDSPALADLLADSRGVRLINAVSAARPAGLAFPKEAQAVAAIAFSFGDLVRNAATAALTEYARRCAYFIHLIGSAVGHQMHYSETSYSVNPCNVHFVLGTLFLAHGIGGGSAFVEALMGRPKKREVRRRPAPEASGATGAATGAPEATGATEAATA